MTLTSKFTRGIFTHDAGRRLWPMATAAEISDTVRDRLAAGYAESQAFFGSLDDTAGR